MPWRSLIIPSLIEEVTQQSFLDYMEKGILKPLDMEKLSFDWEAIAKNPRFPAVTASINKPKCGTTGICQICKGINNGNLRHLRQLLG
jgi:CubicO group peptidase (beta-lactamase class C family)